MRVALPHVLLAGAAGLRNGETNMAPLTCLVPAARRYVIYWQSPSKKFTIHPSWEKKKKGQLLKEQIILERYSIKWVGCLLNSSHHLGLRPKVSFSGHLTRSYLPVSHYPRTPCLSSQIHIIACNDVWISITQIKLCFLWGQGSYCFASHYIPAPSTGSGT